MEPNFRSQNFFRFETEWAQLIDEQNINLTKPCKILELGTGTGSAAFWIVNNMCVNQESVLTTVDNFEKPGQYIQTVTNMKSTRYPERVTIINSDIQQFAFYNNVYYDFVYLDAAHNAKDVYWQICFSERWLNTSGALIVDDTHLDEVNQGIERYYKRSKSPLLKEIWYAGSQRAFIKETHNEK